MFSGKELFLPSEIIYQKMSQLKKLTEIPIKSIYTLLSRQVGIYTAFQLLCNSHLKAGLFCGTRPLPSSPKGRSKTLCSRILPSLHCPKVPLRGI
jgi:hypothetical protein